MPGKKDCEIGLRTVELERFRSMIVTDFSFHDIAPYSASKKTPVHRWYLRPESTSIKWVETIVSKLRIPVPKYIFDPFFGSGSTALYCRRNNIDFLGSDWDSEATVATYAKVCANTVRLDEFATCVKSTNESLLQLLKTNSYCSSLDVIEFFTMLATNIQKSIATSNFSLSTRCCVLASLYKTLRIVLAKVKQTQSNGVVDVWNHAWSKIISQMLSDFKYEQHRVSNSETTILCGDSSRLDWCGIVAGWKNENFSMPGLLLTSPTFVDTSGDFGLSAAICGNLAKEFVNDCNIFAPKLSLKAQSEIASDVLGDSLEYIMRSMQPLLSVLKRYKQFARSGSNIVIENENPEHGGVEVDVDLMICHVAEKMGYRVEKISQTHSVIRPGSIVHSTLGKRGTLIYLSVPTESI